MKQDEDEWMYPDVTGRFAPTPSGRLHLGNLLCALLAYLSARHAGGRFLLRIEDLDAPRCPRRLAQQAVVDLCWFGFRWDAPPLYQSERTAVYQSHLERLQARRSCSSRPPPRPIWAIRNGCTAEPARI